MSHAQNNQITIIFVINGKEVPEEKVNVNQPLKVPVQKALGDNSRPISDYDALYENNTLDFNLSVGDNKLVDGAHVFLSLKGGKGGN